MNSITWGSAFRNLSLVSSPCPLRRSLQQFVLPAGPRHGPMAWLWRVHLSIVLKRENFGLVDYSHFYRDWFGQEQKRPVVVRSTGL